MLLRISLEYISCLLLYKKQIKYEGKYEFGKKNEEIGQIREIKGRINCLF